MSDLATGLAAFGLSLDIVGVLLLYHYGLPSRFPEKGIVIAYSGGPDEEVVEREQRKFRYRSRLGLWLLASGFLLQLVGTLLPKQ